MKTTFTLLFALLVTFSYAAPGKKQVRLQLTHVSSQLKDVTNVFVDQGVTPTYNWQEDVQKVFSSQIQVPQLYSLTSDAIPCLTNSYGSFTTTTTIALGVKVDSAGNYTFAATLLDNIDPTSIVRLKDNQFNTFHDFRQGAYTFEMNQGQQTDTRFELQITFPTQISTADALCNNNEGAINLVQDNAISWTACQLYDENNALVAAFNNATGTINFSNLPSGNYSVAFILGSYVATKPINVKGFLVSVNAYSSAIAANVGEVINFFPMSKNATQFTWYFGDSSIINGIANPEFFYQEPGDYEVIVKVSNSQGCEAFDTIFLTIYAPSSVSSFTIENAKVWSAGKQVFVANNSDDLKLNFQLYNLSGQLVATSVLESQNQSLDLAQLPTGLYVAQLTNSIGQKFTRKLSLQ